MKKAITRFLWLVVVLFVSATSYATDYNVWVGGVQVTDSNKNDVLGDGTVRMDIEAGVNSTMLILNNANISNSSGPAIQIGSGPNDTTFNNGFIAVYALGNDTITSLGSDGIAVYGDNIEFEVSGIFSKRTGNLTLSGSNGIRAYGNNTTMFFVNLAQSSMNIEAVNIGVSATHIELLLFCGNNKIKATSPTGHSIVCDDIIQRTGVATASQKPSINLTLVGNVLVRDNRVELNNDTTDNYFHYPASACVTDSTIYNVATGQAADSIVISHGVTRYNVWVKGVEVTSHNAGDILGDSTASYEHGGLFLNNFNIAAGEKYYLHHGASDNYLPYIFNAAEEGLEFIDLQGINTIDVDLNVSGKKGCFVQSLGLSDVEFWATGAMSVNYNGHNTANACAFHATTDIDFRFSGRGMIEYHQADTNSWFSNKNVIHNIGDYQAYWNSNVNTTIENCVVEPLNIYEAIDGQFKSLFLVPAYPLYVSDVRVDDYNKNDIVSKSDTITGVVTYEPTTNTLTLENATIYPSTPDSLVTLVYGIRYIEPSTHSSKPSIYSSKRFDAPMNGNEMLKVNLIGNNDIIINAPSDFNALGISSSVTFEGPGNLNMTVSGELAVGVVRDINVQGTGNITIATTPFVDGRAVNQEITAASHYMMYSGADATTATLKTPMPLGCNDTYVRFVAPLTFTDTTAMDIPASVVGTAIDSINCINYVSGGVAPYTFSATGLPAGIVINDSTGVISGTPTAATTAGTATITVTDADDTSQSVTIAYGAITTPIAPLVFTDNSAMDIPASVVGTAIDDINCATYVSGGKAPYTFSATGLPAGITIDAATGIISGTPTAATTAGTATITVTDANNTTKSVTIAYGEITEEVVAIDNINNDELIVWSRDGFIGCSVDEYTIYSINGTDVTAQNGTLLRGSYIVRSAHGVAKITIK